MLSLGSFIQGCFGDVRLIEEYLNSKIYLLDNLPSTGITMATTKTRRPPNCFNFLRQLEILGRAGHDGTAEAFTVLKPKYLAS